MNFAPLPLAFLCVFASCRPAQQGSPAPASTRAERQLETRVYQVPSGYLKTLALLLAEETNDPFGPPGPGVLWDPSPPELLTGLGFRGDPDFVYYFDPGHNALLLRADEAGHAELLSLHRELGIPIEEVAEQSGS